MLLERLAKLTIDADFNLALDIVIFSLYLWLAFYVWQRGAKTFLTRIISFAIFTQSIYFFANSLVTMSPNLDLTTIYARSFAWTNYLPIAFWFHAAWLVKQYTLGVKSPRRVSWSVLLIYVFAIFCTILEGITDSLKAYSQTTQFFIGLSPTPHFYIKSGDWFFVAIVYLAFGAGGAGWNLLRSYRYERNILKFKLSNLVEQQLLYLLIGAVLFLAGSLFISINFALGNPLLDPPGHLILLLGLFTISINLARYNQIIAGKDISRNFKLSLTNFIAIAVSFLLLYTLLVGLPNLGTLIWMYVLLSLLVINQFYGSRFNAVLSNIFFTEQDVAEVKEAVEINEKGGMKEINTVITATEEKSPVPIENEELSTKSALPDLDETYFIKAVCEVLDEFANTQRLLSSPLLKIWAIDTLISQAMLEDNLALRVETLRTLLREYVEQLRPLSQELKKEIRIEHYYYCILKYGCLQGLGKKGLYHKTLEVIDEDDRLLLLNIRDVSEPTYYRQRKQAMLTVAKMLYLDYQQPKQPQNKLI